MKKDQCILGPPPVSVVASPPRQPVFSPPLFAALPVFSSSPPAASHSAAWLAPLLPATGPLWQLRELTHRQVAI